MWIRTKALYNVIIAVLGKRFCNLRIRPIVLFILHSTVSRCFSKDKRVSRMMPRSFWDVVCITLLLLNTSEGCVIASDFRLKMNSCACFFMIWVETHFPLKCPSIYLCQVAIQYKSRGTTIMNHRKKDVS